LLPSLVTVNDFLSCSFQICNRLIFSRIGLATVLTNRGTIFKKFWKWIKNQIQSCEICLFPGRVGKSRPRHQDFSSRDGPVSCQQLQQDRSRLSWNYKVGVRELELELVLFIRLQSCLSRATESQWYGERKIIQHVSISRASRLRSAIAPHSSPHPLKIIRGAKNRAP
jgi:hypothetical protein